MKYILSFMVVCLLYNCTSKPSKNEFSGIMIGIENFHPQFISIVDEYVSCHPDYDSYMIASSFAMWDGDERCKDRVKKNYYYIMPLTRSYEIKYSSDHSIFYTINEFSDLSFYIKIRDKAVYIKSDIDILSSRILRNDSIQTPKIESKKTGGEIWCFAHSCQNKFRIVSKDVENSNLWPRILIEKIPCDINFHP